MNKKSVPTLSDKQYRMVAEYFDNGFNKAQAMRAVGFAEKSCTHKVAETFNHLAVQAEVERRHKLKDTSSALDREWITSRLMALVESSVRLNKYVFVDEEDGGLFHDFTGATEEDLKYIKSLTNDFFTTGTGDSARIQKKFKVEASDPHAVLSTLARIEGLFADRLKLEGDEGIVEALIAGRKRAGKAPAD